MKSIKQLQKELKECNDEPIRKLLIMNKIKNTSNIKYIKSILSPKPAKPIIPAKMDVVKCSLDALLELNESDDETMDQELTPQKTKNEYFDIEQIDDDKYNKEIKDDFINNKLKDRLQNEAHFKGTTFKELSKPFSDDMVLFHTKNNKDNDKNNDNIRNKEKNNNNKILGLRIQL